jgi:ribosomal protein S18 acetylase RimI-like enzyme
MHIRTITAADYSRLLSLWLSAGLTIDFWDEKASWLWSLNHFGTHYLAAEDQGEIVGSVLGAFEGRRGWIYHLAVLPRLQHHGIGTALMEAAEQSLWVAGCRKVNLLIENHNRAVIPFYLNQGYNASNVQFMEKILHPNTLS